MIRKIIFRTFICLILILLLITDAEGQEATKMTAFCLCIFFAFELSILARRPWLAYLILAAAFAAVLVFLYLQGAPALKYLMAAVTAAFTAYETYYGSRLEEAERQARKVRDEWAELSDKLMRANKSLRREQDRAVHLAALGERSRIAREIHDNVGHMLSRAIILLGAIRTVNQDQTIDGHLNMLADTLDQAMRQMRSSVHDLKDDSVDLQENINEIAERIPDRFTVEKDIDITPGLDARRVLTLIAVCREAVSNIIRHSNGDRVRITIHEHPGFVTLTVWDNGQAGPETEKMLALGEDSGIGLSNIRERAQELGGTADFSAENGFRVFVNLTKTRPGSAGSGA